SKPVFEFTRRKRWADLLITELSEAIILVLSPNASVWYCGNAVYELLGWRDAEWVDKPFLNFVNVDDRTTFQNLFRDSVVSKSELTTYTRLQCKPPSAASPSQPMHPHAAPVPSQLNDDDGQSRKEVLFEIKGFPHYQPHSDSFKCLFAVAKPYPSRNTAILNTFLELKLENERLHERLAQLKLHKANPHGSQPKPSSTPSSTSQKQSIPAATSFFSGTYDELMSLPGQSQQRKASGNLVFEHVFSGNGGMVVGTSTTTSNSNSGGGNGAASPTIDDPDAAARIKKARKIYIPEQYVCVTCGRTDSPEWRKGPLGPKTLCNACGLRWAKKEKERLRNGGRGGGSG
ncbi:hypothetical protein K474DRAFT_1576588, partial [Panus rudis PR-1116 ss-1]